MQFPPNPTTELVLPVGLPFAPGNDVIGIGVDNPPELQAEGIFAGIIAYNSAYDPTQNAMQVQYSFIGFTTSGATTGTGGAIVMGFGINNPFLGTPIQVINALVLGMDHNFSNAALNTSFGINNHNNNTIFAATEAVAAGDGAALVQDDPATDNLSLIAGVHITTGGTAQSWRNE